MLACLLIILILPSYIYIDSSADDESEDHSDVPADDEPEDRRDVRQRVDTTYDASESESDDSVSSGSFASENVLSLPSPGAEQHSPGAQDTFQQSPHQSSFGSTSSSSSPSHSRRRPSSRSSSSDEHVRNSDQHNDDEDSEAAERELYQNFLYEALRSDSDNDTVDSIDDKDYSSPSQSSPMESSDSEQDVDQAMGIAELSTKQKQYNIVVKEMRNLHIKNHLSEKDMVDVCDMVMLAQLAAGAPFEDIQPLQSLHRLNKRFDAIVDDEAPIGARKTGKIKEYAVCKKCDHLLEVRPVVNCECQVEHNNLLWHTFNHHGEVKNNYSKTCKFKSAPNARHQRVCGRPYAQKDARTGKWKEDKSAYMLSIDSIVREIAKSENYERDMKDRFEFERTFGTGANMPWNAPFWKELEERIGPGMLSEENWQNMVALLTFDGFEKSRGHGGHGGKLCKYIKVTCVPDCY